MPRLISENLEKEIKKQFLYGHNTKYLSEYYNIPQLRINRILKRQGIEKIPKNMLDITLDDEKRIVELYNKGFSTCDIANIYFKDKIKCDRTVANILRKNNVILREFGSENKVFNDTFFETIDTEEKAYFLGFIYADGNIRIEKNNSHLLQIELQQSDDYILKELVRCLEYKEKVKDYKNEIVIYKDKELNYFTRENRFDNYSKLYNGCSLQVPNKKIYEDLLRLGVRPRKTFNMNFPIINKDLYRHFIRGYFDGDGTFSSTKICFYGQHNFLQEIKSIIENDISSLNNNKIFDKKNEKVSMLTYGNKQGIIDIYHYFYDNSKYYLKRKFNELSLYVNTEVTGNSTVERRN